MVAVGITKSGGCVQRTQEFIRAWAGTSALDPLELLKEKNRKSDGICYTTAKTRSRGYAKEARGTGEKG